MSSISSRASAHFASSASATIDARPPGGEPPRVDDAVGFAPAFGPAGDVAVGALGGDDFGVAVAADDFAGAGVAAVWPDAPSSSVTSPAASTRGVCSDMPSTPAFVGKPAPFANLICAFNPEMSRIACVFGDAAHCVPSNAG